jgi:deazaflavin-dependent oxidoreductase (nitroreductase family)
MANSETSEELLQRTLDFIADHRARYLASGGAEGHLIDMSHVGVPGLTPTLLLGTVGRRSGARLIAPLIYGCYGKEWVVIASKGGSPEHPAWFLNMREQAEVAFQVATQCFRATWREAEGEERARVWDYMGGIYPPYHDYQQTAGARRIPVVMLRPGAPIPVFAPDAD